MIVVTLWPKYCQNKETCWFLATDTFEQFIKGSLCGSFCGNTPKDREEESWTTWAWTKMDFKYVKNQKFHEERNSLLVNNKTQVCFQENSRGALLDTRGGIFGMYGARCGQGFWNASSSNVKNTLPGRKDAFPTSDKQDWNYLSHQNCKRRNK